MKNTLRILATFLAFTFFSSSVYAQADDVKELLELGREDASLLAQGYLEPLFVGLGYGFSNGWYNTAKPHGTLGFDFNISFSMVAIPDEARTFTINPAEYNSISGVSQPESPTVFGRNEDGADVTYSYTHEETGSTYSGTMTLWPGLGLKEEIGFQRIPAPTLQLGIGIVKNTDLIIRYIPRMKFDGYRVGLFGFGIKHDVKQWIPGFRLVPIDVSILGAYSSFKNRYAFDEVNQANEALFTVNNWTAQLLVSKKLSVFTFYGGIGYQSVISHFDLKGEYELEGPTFGDPITFVDPIGLKYTKGAMRGTLGMRLKFGAFTMHGDYTIQKYNIWSAGIGLAFR